MKNITTLFLAVIALQQSAFSQSLEWAKWMGSEYSDITHAVTTDADGNVFITGQYRLTVDFDPGAGVFEMTSSGTDAIFVSKFDVDGNFLWAVSMSGTLAARGRDIALTEDGNIVIVGDFFETVDFDPGVGEYVLEAESTGSVFSAILDGSGNFIWAGVISGTGFVYSEDLGIDSQGNIVIGGYFGNSCDFNPNSGENIIDTNEGSAFVVKLQPDGTFMWATHIEGSADSDVKCFTMAVDNQDNILLGGSFSGTVDFNMESGGSDFTAVGSADIYACKLDSDGNFLWVATTGGGSLDAARTITSDNDGNVYVSGDYIGGMDFDPSDGVFTMTTSSFSDNDCFIWKLSPDGALIWAKSLGGDGNDISTSINVDGQGHVYTVGGFNGEGDYNPGAGVFELDPATVNFFDAFISVLDANGDFVWAGQIGSTGYDLAFDVNTDALGNMYVCGYINLTVDMDPTAGEYEIAAGAWDAYILKLSEITSGVSDLDHIQNAVIYPNPGNGLFQLETKVQASTPFTISDVNGKIICTGKTTGSKTTVDISKFETGVYFLKVEEQVVKVVVE